MYYVLTFAIKNSEERKVKLNIKKETPKTKIKSQTKLIPEKKK
jgi:hypothetical protein